MRGVNKFLGGTRWFRYGGGCHGGLPFIKFPLEYLFASIIWKFSKTGHIKYTTVLTHFWKMCWVAGVV